MSDQAAISRHALPGPIAERADRFASHNELALPPDARWVIGLSDFAAQVARSERQWFAEGLAAESFNRQPDAAALEAELSGVAAATDMAALKRALRRLRNRWQFGIVWRHLLRLASFEETVGALSDLADALIEAALGVVERWEAERHGEPLGASSNEPQRLAVLALGKLGGRELNLSSDVDLIFTFAEDGRTASGLSNRNFFTRVGQRLIEALHSVTEDGFTFRVDMRLRPYGGSGALVMDCAAMTGYFETQGRDWERYAFIKARPCAGDLALGAAFLDAIEPFVYRRYLDFGAIDEMRAMKARRMDDRRRADDLKLGAGGIRDAEFCVQVQQLVRGGQQPELRQPGFLAALGALGDAGVFDPEAARELGAAYRFLRDSEHSIQAEADRQSQRLPASDLSRLRLARSLGFDGYEAYLAALAIHRSRVEAVFERLLVTDAPDPERDLWASRSVPLALARAGFGDGIQAVALLDELAKARDRASVGEAGRRRLNELMPRLLQALSLAKDPLQGLTRLMPLLRAVLRRSTYLALLRDHPEVAERLVRVACRSLWLAEQIRQRPRLLSLLIDRPSVKLAPDRQALSEALGQQLAEVRDEEALLDALRAFKERHVFQVAAAEALGGLALMHVSDYLTHLAEAVLEHSLGLAWDQCEIRHGAPDGLNGRPFVIVGYGKLGGIELGPGSDLDIVFVHDLPLAHAQFAHRLVRKLLHYLTAPTYMGPLYEVDMRLRPSGSAGTLMTSLNAFVEYQRSRAWVWEHQALVRARAVAGDAELQRRFEQTRIDLLCQPRAAETLRAEVNRMRQRIAAHQRGRGSAADSGGEGLKRGRGSIVDIEFMVQYIVLAHAHEEPALARHSDNVRILEAAKETGVLDGEDADGLTRAYLALRERHHREVLDLKDAGGDAELAVHRGVILDLWQRLLDQPPA